MRVVWTEYALAQLDEAMAFIARARPETAMTWLERTLDDGDTDAVTITMVLHERRLLSPEDIE